MKNNIFESMKTNVVKTANNVKFKTVKHSPEILIFVGIAGIIGSTVMACVATSKLDGTLEEGREKIDKIHDAVDQVGYSEEFTEKDERTELTKAYISTGLKVAELYVPAVILGALSITSIITSHHIMKTRNAELAAAYASVYQGFKEYRKRVADRFGEEVEEEIRYGMTEEEVPVTDENGNETGETETVKKFDPNNVSDYTRFFDETCRGYTKDSEYNRMFLMQQQAYANRKLQTKGFLLLNDVYKMLGIQPTKDGHVVGWLYNKNDKDKENYVDFGLYNKDNAATRRFINGLESVVLLDFNVQGYIYDKLPEDANF